VGSVGNQPGHVVSLRVFSERADLHVDDEQGYRHGA
jgi:hypothetical protein